MARPRRDRRLRATTTLLAGVLAVASCGSSDGTDSSAPRPETTSTVATDTLGACPLLEQDEIESALGRPFETGEGEFDPGTSCSWSAAEPSADPDQAFPPLLSAFEHLDDPDFETYAPENFASAQPLPTDGNWAPGTDTTFRIEGIGEGATIEWFEEDAVTVLAFEGDMVVQLSYSDFSIPQDYPDADTVSDAMMELLPLAFDRATG